MEDLSLPKRLFPSGSEPEIKKINNTCLLPLLTKLKSVVKDEYDEVSEDPLFKDVMAMETKKVQFSGRLVHSMMCRQVITRKRNEIWFVFGGRPLRFSLQEFHAVTGLNTGNDFEGDIQNWEDDGGFWSKLVKNKQDICIKDLQERYFTKCRKWSREDRLRLVYICVIAGVIMSRDYKKEIPLDYIKLVMMKENRDKYPWGRDSFSLLKNCIVDLQDSLSKPGSYVFQGFTYAFQIWAMEAIPSIGKRMGYKCDPNKKEGVRCSNWEDVSVVSYGDIIQIERTFTREDTVYPYISLTGYGDVVQSTDYMWGYEEVDDGVVKLMEYISDGKEFIPEMWPSVEVVVDDVSEEEDSDNESEERDEVTETVEQVFRSRKTKRRRCDSGVEKKRKKVVLERSHGLSSEVKAFLTNLVNEVAKTSTNTIIEALNERMDKSDARMSKIEELVTSTRQQQYATTSREATKDKATKEKSSRRSGRAEKKNEIPTSLTEEFFKKNEIPTTLTEELFSQRSNIDLNIGTQEYLRKETGHLSQASYVPGFDPTQNSQTSGKSFQKVKVENSERLSLFTDNPFTDGMKRTSKDDVLVFVPEVAFTRLMGWAREKLDFKVGPSRVNTTVMNRIMGVNEWLGNDEIDAMMYLFRENINLGRWNYGRIGFMDCIFSVQMKAWLDRWKSSDRKSFIWEEEMLRYPNGELPSHGKTSKRWAVDVDRIYAPVNVRDSHWISVCVNLIARTVDVFDCSGSKSLNKNSVEPFKVLIPHMVKEVVTGNDAKLLKATQYTVNWHPMLPNLNVSACDCGVYALKFIECHVRGLPLSLITDENIKEARVKIASDLLEASMDPVLVERMAKYVPPKYKAAETVDLS